MKKNLLIVMIFLSSCQGIPNTIPKDYCDAENSIIIAAHRFHGINLSFCDEEGYFFIRNDKKCKLFTEKFMRRVGK